MPTGIAWLFGVLILPAAGWFLVVALAQSTAVEEALWLPSDARVLGPITLGLLTAWAFGTLARVAPRQWCAMSAAGAVITPCLPWALLLGFLLLGGDLGLQ